MQEKNLNFSQLVLNSLLIQSSCLKNSLILLKVFKKLFFVNFPIVFKTPTRFLLEEDLQARETNPQEPSQEILTNSPNFHYGASYYGGNISGGILSNHST
ncbi:hypothetical protein HpMS212_15080 [Helicobacter pylori]